MTHDAQGVLSGCSQMTLHVWSLHPGQLKRLAYYACVLSAFSSTAGNVIYSPGWGARCDSSDILA